MDSQIKLTAKVPLHEKVARSAKAVASFIDPNQVAYLILYVTNRCNFRCDFCFYGAEIEKGLKPDELTLDELREVSRKTGPIIQLSMTGGEPFLRKDLAEITRAFIDNANVRYLTIPTNASLTDVMVRYLENVLPDYPDTYFRLVFSIEATGAEHDEIRSMPGSYDKIKESYRAIAPLRRRFPNIVLDSNSVYTARTENTLLDTLEHLSEEFEFDNLSVTYARGEVPNPALKQMSEENYIRINDFLETLKRRKEKRFLYPVWRGIRDVSRQALIRTVFHDEFVTPCVAGRKLVVMSETGEVHPCEILDKSMGNIRNFNYNLSDLLKDAANGKLRDWIIESKCKCSFECALAANVAWNASAYPKLIKSSLANIGRNT